jgi:hypothetical protein
MECVILFRLPNGGVSGILDPKYSDELVVYDNMDAAVAAADSIPILRIRDYQIVVLDEL